MVRIVSIGEKKKSISLPLLDMRIGGRRGEMDE